MTTSEEALQVPTGRFLSFAQRDEKVSDVILAGVVDLSDGAAITVVPE
jgi:hypothetical protein